MAKKRRKEEEEEFQLPEFDEKEFLSKEIISAKMILLVVLLAIVAAVISYFLTMAGIAIVAFFAGLAVVLLLRYLPGIFSIDTSKLERKDWLGYGSTYFFAWLTIWVLVMNVPFSDVTPPGLIVFVNNTQVAPGAESYISSSTVNISAKATDNAGINVVLIQTNLMANPVNMTALGNDLWSYTLMGVTENRSVTVTAEDITGHSSSVTITLVPT